MGLSWVPVHMLSYSCAPGQVTQFLSPTPSAAKWVPPACVTIRRHSQCRVAKVEAGQVSVVPPYPCRLKDCKFGGGSPAVPPLCLPTT